MWPVGHFEVLGLSCFRGHFVLLDCGHCYCSGGRSKVYIQQVSVHFDIVQTMQTCSVRISTVAYIHSECSLIACMHVCKSTYGLMYLLHTTYIQYQ